MSNLLSVVPDGMSLKSSATLLDLKLGEEYVFTHKVNEFGTDVVAAIAPSRGAANRSK